MARCLAEPRPRNEQGADSYSRPDIQRILGTLAWPGWGWGTFETISDEYMHRIEVAVPPK